MSDQEEARLLVWQQPAQLLLRATLERVLSARHSCRPGFFLDGYAASQQHTAGRVSVTAMRREPLRGGVSGAHLERVLVDAVIEQGAGSHKQTFSLILKRMRPAESWLMRASGDTRCREVQLWRHGLLEDAPSVLCVPVLAAAYDAAAGEGALLMVDVGRWLGMPGDDMVVPPARGMAQYFDHLARLHAHYWQDARLNDARFALASVEQSLLMLAPSVERAQLAAGDQHPYLPVSLAGWEAFFNAGPAQALQQIQRVFDAPAALLASAASAPRTLLHGDAWPANMGVLPGAPGNCGWRARSRTILIDWALATAGPATFDPFWLLFACPAFKTRRALLYYRARLTHHLARRGIALSVAEWRLLVDLGIVRTVINCGETMGQGVQLAQNEAQRARAVAQLHWWVNWAARVIERRGWAD